MKSWRVQAVRADGSVEEVFVTAETEALAARQIRILGFTPVAIKAGHRPSNKKVRGSAQASTRLIRELSALVGAGLPVERALASLEKFADKSLTGKVARDLLVQVRAGNSLSQAFAAMPEIFPPPFPQIAEAGEASGSLAIALADLADWREKRQKFESEMRGSLLYPVMLLVFSALAVIGLLVFVVPRFEQIFTDMDATPPAFAGFVFATSNALALYAPIVLGVFIGLGVAISYWLRREHSKWLLYRLSHRLPGIGQMVRAMLAARFCRVLAVLLQNGLSAAPAFRLASAGLTDLFAREKLQKALEEVRRGASLPEQIEKAEVLPPLATEILRVGEEVGDLGPAAKRLATLYEDRLERGTKLVVSIAEPVLIGFVGLVVGGIVLSILLALVSINEIEF